MQLSIASQAGSSDGENEDAVALLGDFVVVADGATARTETGCIHGVAWFTYRLAASTVQYADRGPRAALAKGILETADAHRTMCDLANLGTPSRTPLGLDGWAGWGHVEDVNLRQVEDLRAGLAEFVGDVFASVPRKDQRAKGECYLRGLMLEGRRKSVSAMAGRLLDGDEQNLQQFVNQSTWDPVPVRRRIAQRLVPQIGPDAFRGR